MRGSYRGYDIISAPPPSSGGTALLEALNILEGYDLAKFRGRTTPAVHLTLEAFRRAFFDRAEFMGDPDFSKIPVAQLIDKRYGGPGGNRSIGACQRQQGFGPAGDLQPARTIRVRALPAQRWRGDESYDALFRGRSEGNAVATTTTLNDTFGSRVTAEGSVFL